MARGRKVETGVKRDNKGRILPKGISQRKDGRYIWRYTYNGVTFKPVYSWDLQTLLADIIPHIPSPIVIIIFI